MMAFSWESAFWVNSAVARLVYAEHDRAAPLVAAARADFEAFTAPLAEAAAADALARFEGGDAAAGVAALTDLALTASEEATARWTALWATLMVANADGYSASEVRALPPPPTTRKEPRRRARACGWGSSTARRRCRCAF